MNNVIEELENDITDFISSSSNLNPSDETSAGVATEETPNTEISGEEQVIQAMDVDSELRHRKVTGEKQDTNDSETKDIETEREFTIKLKYLNDDLKLVTAKPTEAIGDFKK